MRHATSKQNKAILWSSVNTLYPKEKKHFAKKLWKNIC